MSNDPNPNWTAWVGVEANTALDDWQLRSVPDDPATVRGYVQTNRAHGASVWSTAGASIGSVADGGTATVNYGGASRHLEREGARFWVRSRLYSGASVTSWSKPDWFETGIETMQITHPASVNIGAAAAGIDIDEDLPISVTTSSEAGWSLYATGEDDTYALSNGLAGATNQLARRTTPTWATGVGGFAGLTVLSATPVAKDPAWGTGTVGTQYDDLSYAWPTRTGPALLLHRVTTHHAGAQDVTLSLRANAAVSNRPGTYTGVLEFVAVPNL